MRIINRVAFLKMPAGTVFSEYQPCFFGGLMIKGDSLPNDFHAQQITDAIFCDGSEDFSEKLFRAQETGESLAMDFDCMGRDGKFDSPERLYAVWERKDVQDLIARLQETLD